MEGKRNIPYSMEDIRNYLDGRLSDSEMQAIEKAALEDPFLADAIEGYEESRRHADSFETGMADLQSRLSKRIRKTNRKPAVTAFISHWKIAAAVLFLLGLTIFSYTFFINTKPKDLSVTDTKVNKKETVPVPPGPKTADTSLSAVEQTPTTPSESGAAGNLKTSTADKERQKFNKKEMPVKTEENLSQKKDVVNPDQVSSNVLADTIVKASRAAAPVQNETEPVPNVKTEELKKEKNVSGLAVSEDKANLENFIQGVVVDEKGKPIPFAPVKIKGAKRETYTDTSGFFKLYMKNPSLAALVFVHPSGYEPVSAELKPDSNLTNRIEVFPLANAKSEAENSGYHTINGWDAFIAYINTNKKITTADSLLKGEEIISFLVHPDGKLSSFKIEKSISPVHDEEIVRLIRSAPPLKVQDGKKQRSRVTISFP